ncbi:U3 small nucleolar RNA-associated protein 22, partial [Teratosphaeria destructans]
MIIMSIPANKRRKLEHQASDDEDDDASFASFGGSEDGQQNGGAQSAMDVDGQNESEEDGQDESEQDGQDESEEDGQDDDDEDDVDDDEEEAEADARETGPADKKAVAKPIKTDRRVERKSTVDPTSSAFSASTFKSNVFKLQVDELLEQIRPRRGKREEAAEQALHVLKKTTEQAAPIAALSVEEAQRHLVKTNKVAVPFPDPRPPKDAKYKLEFARPAGINVVGSYALKIASRAKDALEIDMMVQMPSSLFQEKDYLNHRYFYKRAYYLACVAATVKNAHPSDYDLQFEDLHGDSLKPVLVVNPTSKKAEGGAEKPGPRWRIVIIPCVASDVFPQEKLAPGKNCVRPTGDEEVQPTPFYNAALRADMLLSSYLKLIHTAATSCEAFKDACLLGNTWLRQRGFGSSISTGGFGNFEWSALMASLLQGGGPNGKPMLSAGYSSYQLFKATLQVLAMKDLSKQSLVIGSGKTTPTGDGTPLLWDGSRGHSLLYKVMPWSYQHLRQEARTTLTMLGDQLFDGFEASFILRTDNALLRYDHVLNIPVALIHKPIVGSNDAQDAYRRLYSALKQGLKERVTLITMLPPRSRPWQLGSARGFATKDDKLQVGLVINPDKVNQAVVHGPAAEDKAATAAFRHFWGEKAELRRFKDGSIVESLIWSTQDERSVLEQVVRFIVKRHASEQAEAALTFSDTGFAKLVKGSQSTAAFQPLMEAYKQMELDIRGRQGLPLSIRHIMPSDPQLRYASVQEPSGTQRPVPADVTIQFEGSTRWPDDLAAIQRTKIAFLLDLGRRLEESCDNITAKVGVENHSADILNQAFVDIIYDSGAVFRLRIHHDREQTLLERQLKDKSLPAATKELAATGLAAYKRDCLKTPAHTQAIARLCGRHPPLSGTIRLLKKWFASHLLANHFADEIIELLAARTFVQTWPWQAPSSVQTGFLRTLHWLSRWDWRMDPLIVDLSGSGELKVPEAQSIRTKFEAWRKLDPGLNRVVLFTASNVDPDGTTYTDGRPARVVAGRMTALAKAACSQLERYSLDLDARSLFQSPLSDYDFVIHLNAATTGIGLKNRQGASNGTARFKNLELAALNDESMIRYSPASSFLAELEEVYGSAIVFFSGGEERGVIAGLFSPQTTAKRGWKVNLAFSTVPVREGGEVKAELNREGVVGEIGRIGGDLGQGRRRPHLRLKPNSGLRQRSRQRPDNRTPAPPAHLPHHHHNHEPQGNDDPPPTAASPGPTHTASPTPHRPPLSAVPADSDSGDPSRRKSSSLLATLTYFTHPVSYTASAIVRRLSEDDAPTPLAKALSANWNGSMASAAAATSAFLPAKRKLSPFQPPPLTPLTLHGYKDTTRGKGRLLSKALAEEIRLLVPPRLQLQDRWHLTYSLEQNGSTLSTLYHLCDEHRGKRGGFVLVVRDAHGGIFGAYLTDPPRPQPHYFGTG